jgi:hypothetical protein
MSGPGIFPKENSQTLYAEDVNILYGNFIGMRSTEAETAVNVAKLQYCASVTDIDHDYMVVDVFTDSSGYNDSVCTGDTTSTYCCSGLNGYYQNTTQTNIALVAICDCFIRASCGSACYGDFFACTYASSSGACFGAITQIIADCCLQFNHDCFGLEFCVCMISSSTKGCHSNIEVFFPTSIDCKSQSHDKNTNTSYSELRCYKFLQACSDCFDFYCNGTCKCQITISSDPTLCLKAQSISWICSASTVSTCVYAINALKYGCLSETKIITVPIEYIASAQTSYLSLDKSAVGSGTITYNVYDASTDCQIGTNLAPNTLNTLDDCVACHYYEIIQCSDGVSCIKSYAILAGVY